MTESRRKNAMKYALLILSLALPAAATEPALDASYARDLAAVGVVHRGGCRGELNAGGSFWSREYTGLTPGGVVQVHMIMAHEGLPPTDSDRDRAYLGAMAFACGSADNYRLVHHVIVAKWQALEKPDERFAVGLVTAQNRVMGPAHQYVSPETYDAVQAAKKKFYEELAGKFKDPAAFERLFTR
jgi:hypothetical protein